MHGPDAGALGGAADGNPEPAFAAGGGGADALGDEQRGVGSEGGRHDRESDEQGIVLPDIEQTAIRCCRNEFEKPAHALVFLCLSLS
jgi:hypothetical protein